jgi:death-on-curing family protein
LGKIGSSVRFFRASDFIAINEQIIRLLGGLFNSNCSNVLNFNSLEYLAEFSQTELVLSMDDNSEAVVAAFYAHHIINGHVFVDGNKRTGMFSAFLFLQINGYQLNNVDDDEIVEISLRIESKSINLNELIQWFKTIITR